MHDFQSWSLLLFPPARQVCQEMGCFECYDIYCERCESKDSCHQLLFEADSLVPDLTIHQDRRIIELEMRNTELARALAGRK